MTCHVCCHCPLQLALAVAPSGKRTKSAQCEARLVCSKYVGVDWTVCAPYVNDTEAIQPIVRQERAVLLISATAKCLLITMQFASFPIRKQPRCACRRVHGRTSHVLVDMHSESACILNVCPSMLLKVG